MVACFAGDVGIGGRLWDAGILLLRYLAGMGPANVTPLLHGLRMIILPIFVSMTT